MTGEDPIRPISSFDQLSLDKTMKLVLEKLNYKTPTPIQRQAIPIALAGRDMIGVAQTGSGKTFAFLMPMMTHIMNQRELSHGEGPIALVMAPTKELAHQIYKEAKKCGKRYKLR